MNTVHTICQSCGMPLDKDPQGGGTNADHSRSNLYCSYCYQDGKFVDEGISLEEKIEKNIQMAISMHMSENQARHMARSILPSLQRWQKKA